VIESSGMFVERMNDEGQGFEQGERVEFFPRAGGHLRPTLGKAALGSYEVVTCSQVHTHEGRWLDVTLRRVVPEMIIRTDANRIEEAASGAPGLR
jgi:hypothetical protein